MATAKGEVQRMLDQFAGESSFEDIQSAIYVREKSERGLRYVREGRTLNKEEVGRGILKSLLATQY